MRLCLNHELDRRIMRHVFPSAKKCWAADSDQCRALLGNLTPNKSAAKLRFSNPADHRAVEAYTG